MSSFVRDKDAHTRGVNAIAAVDGAGGRLRRIEARKAVRMASRDHALATMASRAFRPSLSGIGEMKTAALQQLRFSRATGVSPITGTGGAHYGPNTAGGSIGTTKTPVIGTLPPSASTPGTAADPSYGVSGGGGGGSSGVGVMTGQTVATFTPADLDLNSALDPGQTITTDTSVVALPSTGLSANGKKYLVYAGVALAAYFLWQHSKKG